MTGKKCTNCKLLIISVNFPFIFILTDLPRYVHNIVGFSPVKGRMYLRDISGTAFFSSKDGNRIDVISSNSMEKVHYYYYLIPA